MPEERSIAWLLSPEELVAACAAIGIVGLPHSRWVDEAILHEAHVASAGGRSLEAARLARTEDGVLVVEPALVHALLSLNGNRHEAVASFTGPGPACHVAVFQHGRATTMVDSSDGIELATEGAGAAMARLDALLGAVHARATGIAAGTAREAGSAATISIARWQALVEGRPPRRSDAPLAVAAAAATALHGVWEGGCLRMNQGGGYRGCTAGWVVDHDGLMTVEFVEPDAEGEVPLAVTAVADLSAEIFGLWNPIRDLVAGPGETVDPDRAKTRRPVSVT